jgi:hypothetical protein
MFLGIQMRLWGTSYVLALADWRRSCLDLRDGAMLAPACRGDAAARAWRVGLLWRERVGDDGIATAPIATRSLASTLGAEYLLLRVRVLLIVCIFVLIRRGVGRRVKGLANVVGVRGRYRLRRVLGFHSGESVLRLRNDVHQRRETGLEDLRSRRGGGHVIAEAEASLRRGKTLVTYDLRSQGLGRRSWAWLQPSRERAKAGHRLGSE